MKTPITLKPFYFIRHGQSVWNLLDKFAGGQIDTPLTDEGILQAKKAKPVFDAIIPRPTHIFHSHLSRALDTAKILNEGRETPMVEDKNLREIDAGEWAGKSNQEAKSMWSHGQNSNNGESLDMFAQRIAATFNNILSDTAYEIPFISAHGRIINAFDTIYNIPPRSLQIENCQILKFIPSKGAYPWDVYICTLEKNGQLSENLAEWSQV